MRTNFNATIELKNNRIKDAVYNPELLFAIVNKEVTKIA